MYGAERNASTRDDFDEYGSGVLAREFWRFVERIRESGLAPHVRHTAIEIWLHMRPGKMRANPSVARLAQNTGLSERTIQSDIKALADSGIFEVEFSKGGRAQSHNFIARRIAETAHELRGLLDIVPDVVTPFRRNTPQETRPLRDNKPRTACTVTGNTPQETTKNPAPRAPEATLEATLEDSRENVVRLAGGTDGNRKDDIAEVAEAVALVVDAAPKLGQMHLPGVALPQAKEKQKRSDCAKQMPGDWRPAATTVAWAKGDKIRASAEQIEDQLEAFRDYHLSKGSRFVDWDRAFQTWMRNARQYGRLASPSQPSKGNGQSGRRTVIVNGRELWV